MYALKTIRYSNTRIALRYTIISDFLQYIYQIATIIVIISYLLATMALIHPKWYRFRHSWTTIFPTEQKLVVFKYIRMLFSVEEINVKIRRMKF